LVATPPSLRASSRLHRWFRGPRGLVLALGLFVIVAWLSNTVLTGVDRLVGVPTDTDVTSASFAFPELVTHGVTSHESVAVVLHAGHAQTLSWHADWLSTAGHLIERRGSVHLGMGHHATITFVPVGARPYQWLTVSVTGLRTPLQVWVS